MPKKSRPRFNRAKYKLQERLRARLRRAGETPEYKQKRCEQARLRRKLRLAAETQEERENRLAKYHKDQQRKREHLKQARLRRKLRLAAETQEERENRLEKIRKYKQRRRKQLIATESPYHKQKRLESDRLRIRLRQAAETPEERVNRLTKRREYMRRKRKEVQLFWQTLLQDNAKERQKRSKQNPPRKRTRRNAVTPRELEKRIVEDQENNPQQREILYQSLLLHDYLDSGAQSFPVKEDLSLKSSASNNNYLNGKAVHCDNTSAFDFARIKKEPESAADSEKTYVFDDICIKEEPEE